MEDASPTQGPEIRAIDDIERQKETLLTVRRATMVLAVYVLFCILVLGQRDANIFQAQPQNSVMVARGREIPDQEIKGAALVNLGKSIPSTGEALHKAGNSATKVTDLSRLADVIGKLAQDAPRPSAGGVTIPFANVAIEFDAFLVVGPLILIAIWIYLLIFLHRVWAATLPATEVPIFILSMMRGWVPQLLAWLINVYTVPMVLAVFAVRASHQGPWSWAYHGGLLLFATLAALRLSAVAAFRSFEYSAEQDEEKSRASASVPWAGWLVVRLNLELWLIPLFLVGMVYSMQLHRLDLTELNFSGRELRNRALMFADLTRADLIRADLTNSDLTRTNLRFADLTGASLTQANLTRADLTYANFTRANLSLADLTGARFSHAILVDTDLTSTSLKNADFRGATLTRATLASADLTGASFTEANLTGADLTNANFTHANLSFADLTDATFAPAVLVGADLTKSILKNTDFWRAILTRAKLNFADLTGADFTRAILTGADLTNANFTSADLSFADLTGADLTSANLVMAQNLTQKQVDGACYSKAAALLGARPPELPEGFQLPPICPQE